MSSPLCLSAFIRVYRRLLFGVMFLRWVLVIFSFSGSLTHPVPTPSKKNRFQREDAMAARAPNIKNTIAMAPPIQQGRLRGIAQMGEKRSCVLPDPPTLDQLGIHGAQIGGWYGLYAPARARHTRSRLHNL